MTVFKYFDKNGNELKAIDFIEIQWNRKFDETGNFLIYTSAKEWNNNIKYIQNVGRPETGIVQKISYDKQTSGDYLEISGFFLEKLLSFGAHWLPLAVDKTDVDLMDDWFFHYLKDVLPSSDIVAGTQKQALYQTSVNFINRIPYLNLNIAVGTTVEDMLYDAVKTFNYSYYCEPIFNPTTDGTEPYIGVTANVYAGRDKTNDVYFGNAFKNVLDISYTLDESDMFPHYKIVQEVPIESVSSIQSFIDVWTAYDDGILKAYIAEDYFYGGNAPSDLGYSYPTKVLQTNLSDIQITPANEPLIHTQMQKEGKLDMLNHYKIEAISVDVIQNRFLYLTDYTLGDKCSIQIDEIEQQFTARIVEVNEVHRNNASEIQLVLGTPNKVKYIKQYRR